MSAAARTRAPAAARDGLRESRPTPNRAAPATRNPEISRRVQRVRAIPAESTEVRSTDLAHQTQGTYESGIGKDFEGSHLSGLKLLSTYRAKQCRHDTVCTRRLRRDTGITVDEHVGDANSRV